MVDSLVHGVTWLMERVGGSFVSPTARDGLLAILAGFAIGGFAFRYYFGRERFGIRAYLRHAFPRRVYWSRTFAVDVQIFLMDRLLAPMVWFTRVLSVVMVAHGLASGLTHWLGPVTQFERGPVMTGLLAFALLLAVDLGTYVTHRLSHQVPVLWAVRLMPWSGSATWRCSPRTSSPSCDQALHSRLIAFAMSAISTVPFRFPSV